MGNGDWLPEEGDGGEDEDDDNDKEKASWASRPSRMLTLAWMTPPPKIPGVEPAPVRQSIYRESANSGLSNLICGRDLAKLTFC